MKPSFVTWQLRHLHAELAEIDKRRGGQMASPRATHATPDVHRDEAARRNFQQRMLRLLPKRLGFRDAAAFAHAFEQATRLGHRRRRRLSADALTELEQRVLRHERAADIALAVGCAEQTVLNRATKIRQLQTAQLEANGSGI